MGKLTLLLFVPQQSSFATIVVSALTAVPVYTARTVSKLDERVSNEAVPVTPAGATHEYQTDAPLGIAACCGSPVSVVAPTFVPVTVPLVPVTDCAFAKLSFAGPVADVQCSEILPVRTPVEPL